MGCSAGVSAGLSRGALSMDELYAHYADVDGLDRAELLDRDRAWPVAHDVRFIGLDGAGPAPGYAYAGADGLAGAELLGRDRALPVAHDVRFIGLDVAGPALDYARAAGFLEAAVCADLENNEPTPEQRAILAQADRD